MDGALYVEDVLTTTELDGASTINPLMLGLDGTFERPHSISQDTFDTFSSPRHSPLHAFRSSPPIAIRRREEDATTKAARDFASLVFPPSFPQLPHSTLRSGVVYSPTMRLHAEPPVNPEDKHPEDPARIASIYQELVDAGLAPVLGQPSTEEQLLSLPILFASEEQLCLVHTAEHVDFIRSLEGMHIDQLRREAQPPLRDSVYFNNNTWLCAQMSAGGAIVATRAVVSGKVKNAFAIIRPPGHHAEREEPSGFCMFNNVPIAAKVMQKEFPECRKILILDWDVHHGNGIQNTFYEDANVLYISLHVYKSPDGGRFYPHTDKGDPYNCGEGLGKGKNVNIAWDSTGMTDADYLYAFQQVVMPIAIEFDPDLVMISAGFDAAEGDPLGGCHVSPAGYGHMTHMLMQLAKGKVVACLEGGYNLSAISRSSLAMTRVLMGEPPDRLTSTVPTKDGIASVQRVVRIQSKFWKTLFPKSRDMIRKAEMGSQRLHDVVRDWQASVLWKEHKMSQLFILRQQISKSFENQVLATPNYHEERPLLVIFHDPPEAQGHPDVRTNQLELHNTWLTDVSKSYIDWARSRHFAVIDINIPKHITAPTAPTRSTSPVANADSEATREAATHEVATYLFRNYIETSDYTHLFILGIGEAYLGVIKLLSDERMGGAALDAADHVFGFLGENAIRALRVGDDLTRITQWYEKSSMYVSSKHSVWEKEVKLKKRHGRVVKSKEAELQDMLFLHRDKVTAKMEEITHGWEEKLAAKKSLAAVANGGTHTVGGGVPDDELGDGLARNNGAVGFGEVLSASGVVNGSLNRRGAEVSLDEGGPPKRPRNGI